MSILIAMVIISYTEILPVIWADIFYQNFTQRFKNKTPSGNTQVQRKNSEHLIVLHPTVTGMVDSVTVLHYAQVQHSTCLLRHLEINYHERPKIFEAV